MWYLPSLVIHIVRQINNNKEILSTYKIYYMVPSSLSPQGYTRYEDFPDNVTLYLTKSFPNEI